MALNGVVLLSTLVEAPARWSPQPGFWGFLVVIILTSPLQAAAEEVFFRGYLMQALGSLVAKPWFGVVVSALVFALLHGTQNLPLFLDRLGFGLLAAVLVWRTGGLEAGIAAHVINNVFAYVLAGLTTSIAEIRAISEIGWVDAAFDVGGFALFAVLAYLVARRLRLPTRVQLGFERAGSEGVKSLLVLDADHASGMVGYGVIGSPADSGSVSLGSSPSTPAQGTARLEAARLGPRCVAA